MPKICTLGPLGRRTSFCYTGSVADGFWLEYTGRPFISAAFCQGILQAFKGKRVAGGFSMTDAPAGGFGAWVRDNSARLGGHKLTPRHAAHIAAVFVHEGYATRTLEGSAVYLRFKS